jgi:hypothetical protein
MYGKKKQKVSVVLLTNIIWSVTNKNSSLLLDPLIMWMVTEFSLRVSCFVLMEPSTTALCSYLLYAIYHSLT